MSYHGGWMGLWLVVVLAVWLVPLVLSYFVLNRRHSPQDDARRSARDVLDEAYARGAISREEYLQKRTDLGSR